MGDAQASGMLSEWLTPMSGALTHPGRHLAADDPASFRLKYGCGGGARWTTLGPIRQRPESPRRA